MMGKCMFMRKGSVHSEPVTFDPVFANNDWAQIIEACQKNKVPDTWVVGDQKAMTINGTDYLIDIIGKNHDVYSDGSGTAPLTFQMHYVYDTKYKMNSAISNTSGWTDSGMRKTNLPAILALMPDVIQAGIKEVNKKTSAGNQSTTINITADKLFLLSEIEYFGKVSYSKSGEGEQYAYYAAGNNRKKTTTAGNSSNSWERSPDGRNSKQFCMVDTGGIGLANTYNANGTYGVAFAFCF